MSIVAPEQLTAPPPEITAPPQAAPPPEIAPAPQPAPPPGMTPPAQVVPLPVGVRPTIVANRKLLVKRFSSLGFTISTGGLPYWEVLLFTDRSLIDPVNAGRRTPLSFYSSRQESGLRRAPASGDDVFLVPSSVLRGFASAVPKPSAIYYTVAAYGAPDGGSPVLPASPQQLAVAAPSVAVSPDFTPDTVGQVLGVPSMRLRVVAQALDAAWPTVAGAPVAAPATSMPPTAGPATSITDAPIAGASTPVVQTPEASPAPAMVAAPAPPAAPPVVDPAADAGVAEDGYAYYVAHPEMLAGDAAPQPLVAVAPQPARADEEPYDDGYGAYDEGWNAQEASWAGGLEAPFPHGFPEPAPLLDEDGARWSAQPPEELAGVATHFPYRGLDEPDGQTGANGSAVTEAPQTAAAPAPVVSAPPPLALAIDDKRAIIEKVAGSESGTDRYGAINADGEYKGRFGPNHSAYHHHHIGLSYGLIQFTQESGNLGRLLVLMRDRDEATFGQIFGEHAAELIQVTTAEGPPSSDSPDGRSARTQPVGGVDLWEEPWIGRFRQAGQVTAFQAAQNELAASAFVDPVLRFAGDLGLDTDRALTMVVDRAVQMGVQGAQHWVIAAVGPISTTALRQQALSAVGVADIASFQAAFGLDPDNLWGPVSHAALVGALRQLGSASPIPLPTVDQMLDAMVRRAEGDNAFWAGRVKRLRTAAGFTDQAYAR